jgi:3-isopropylmalate/(R)-2-methylmalate dehydratase small subunit
MSATKIRGRVFVVGDNIDTDQIIPAHYLNLVPTIPDEYEKLGSYAFAGLPEGNQRFVPEGSMKTTYPIIVAGRNFGCGSSREHAPIAIGAAGGEAVVAESYARIFFRNCVATGELYPVETPKRIVDHFKTGDEAELDLDASTITNLRTGERLELNPLGDARPVIDAGGLFEYARRTGMIPASASPDTGAKVPLNTTVED